jgi:hypothetical protein
MASRHTCLGNGDVFSSAWMASILSMNDVRHLPRSVWGHWMMWSRVSSEGEQVGCFRSPAVNLLSHWNVGRHSCDIFVKWTLSAIKPLSAAPLALQLIAHITWSVYWLRLWIYTRNGSLVALLSNSGLTLAVIVPSGIVTKVPAWGDIMTNGWAFPSCCWYSLALSSASTLNCASSDKLEYARCASW